MKRSVSYLMSVVLLGALVMCRSDAQVLYTLTVEKSGAGTGTVTGDGIDCGVDCTEQYEDGTPVVLQAQEDLDSTFDGWLVNGNPATGEITVTDNLTVTAIFSKKPDTDNDGLPDEWEQQIIDADPADGITTVEEVLPADDFDGDDLTNEEEFWNQTDPTTPTKWFVEIIPMDVSGTQTISEIQRLVSFRMDVQLRFLDNSGPAKLVRTLTILVDGGGMFASTANIGSVQKDPNFPGKITATTDENGQFSINLQGTQPGRMAFSTDQPTAGTIPDDFVASYPFSEGFGTITVDESENGNDGTLLNGVSWTTDGRMGNALNFNGIDGYVEVADDSVLRLGTTHTIAGWVNLTQLSSDWVRVIGKGDVNYRNYGVWVSPTGTVAYQIVFSNGYWFTILSTTQLNPGSWYHLAAIYDGSTMRLYIDGQEEDNTNYSQTPYVTSDPLTFGYAGYHTYLNGLIDEVKIYNRALSASEINALAAGAGIQEIASVSAPFLTAVWEGRQLDFAGGDSVEIRIHDLAHTLQPTYYTSEDPTWEIEGISFEYVTISKQGYLLFGQQTPLTTTDIALQDAPDGLLAPFLDDLIMKPESRIYVNWDWLIEPCFTVQWCRMGHVSDPDASITFQIQLWQRSQQVRFVYELLKNGSGTYADGHDAVIGFKYATDSVYAWTQPLSSFSALEVIDVSAPFVDVFALDVDQDRLEKTDEESLGTDPDNWDSDFDGMSDGWEQTFSAAGLNPLQPDEDADADGDGYLNIIEYYLGAQPDDPDSPEYCEPDSDQDGMPDSWETTYGLDPNSADDALIDTDDDWYVNVLEYAIGGDPTDAAIQGTHPAEPEGGMSHATYP